MPVLLVCQCALEFRQTRAFDGDAGDGGGVQVAGAIVAGGEGLAQGGDAFVAGQDHDAAAEAGPGDFGAGHAGNRYGHVDHLVDLRCAARIAAGLHEELRRRTRSGLSLARSAIRP